MRRKRSSTHSMRFGIAAPYVFTTGGIGPTRGDITADCGEGVRCSDRHRSARSRHPARMVETTGAEMNEARLRLTRIPKVADLILNKVQRAQSKSGLSFALSRRKQGGSSPLGSANQINGLYRIGQLLLFLLQFFSKSIAGHAGPACCAFSCLRFPMRSKPLHSEGRGRTFESSRARQ